MNQREVILAAWQRHKKNRASSAHLRKAEEFFDLVANSPDICWTELSEEFRRNYYDAFDEIVPVLFDTDDALIVHNCVRFAELANPKESEAATKLIHQVDSDKHEVTMVKLARHEHLQPAMKKVGNLPASVKAALGGGRSPAPKTATRKRKPA